MAVRTVPFGAYEGFSDEPITGTHFYSQNLFPSLFGAGTMFSLVYKAGSDGIPTLGSVLHHAYLNGVLYVQDDAGKIWKESSPGSFSFSNVRSPGGNGAGLMADQYGNLFYACGSSNNQLGKYDGTTWNDTFQTLQSGQHPMDWYEDLVIVLDVYNVACLFSDGSWSDTAFTLPTELTLAAVCKGPTGILLGANMGNQGALIVWDGNSPRSKYPWKWVTGKILSIQPYGAEWIVKTDRQLIITNGVSIKEFSGIFDDPMAFNPYDSTQVLPQQTALMNDVLIFLVTSASGDVTQYGKKKPGLYLYSLARKAWAFVPIHTGATFNVLMNAVSVDLHSNRIVVSYSSGGVNYIAQLTSIPPTRAQFVSELLGLGRIKYQRTFFGPTDKTLEAVILNMNVLNSSTQAEPLTFTMSVKAYNFKRQLWGHAVTSGALSNTNQIKIDATIAGTFDAKVGDEVTILEGQNAGFSAHITEIANDGLSNETWTLDQGPAYNTAEGVNVQVQPFTLIKRQTFSSLAELKNFFFSVNSIKGKQFLIKVVLESITTGLSLELQMNYWVFNDLGATQT